MSAIRYAKVGGPPNNWRGLRIVDLDTGAEIRRVIEVDADRGWLIRLVTDENGRLKLNDTRTEVARERVTGRFEIRTPSKDLTPC